MNKGVKVRLWFAERGRVTGFLRKCKAGCGLVYSLFFTGNALFPEIAGVFCHKCQAHDSAKLTSKKGGINV